MVPCLVVPVVPPPSVLRRKAWLGGELRGCRVTVCWEERPGLGGGVVGHTMRGGGWGGGGCDAAPGILSHSLTHAVGSGKDRLF